MKKIIFVIDSINCGGAEKSLTALLQSFDYSKAAVDLLVFTPGGLLGDLLPRQVNRLPVPPFFQFMQNPSWKKYFNPANWIFVGAKIKIGLHLRINALKKRPIHGEQVVFQYAKTVLDPLVNEYDVAVAYSQGMPTYFTRTKITARRRISWINCDYEKTLYDKQRDAGFYSGYETIVCVSEHVRNSVKKVFPDFASKLEVICDIVNPRTIRTMAEESGEGFDDDFCGARILTVGRLVAVKGYPLAIRTCRMLRDAGYPIRWYVIGEGAERTALEKLIQNEKLGEDFRLLGQKNNPYPWMKACDLYVQPSLKEGLCLTAIEAKILARPIVCTDFETSGEILASGRDGVIVEKSEEKVFQAIKELLDSPDQRQRLIKHLEIEPPFDTTEEIDKFYSIARLSTPEVVE